MDPLSSIIISEELAASMSPQEAARYIRQLSVPHALAAIQTLVAVAANPRANPAARVMAANSLLDRAFGKPEQPIPLTLPPGIGKTGVMLIPSSKGRDEWLQQAQQHHDKVLNSPT